MKSIFVRALELGGAGIVILGFVCVVVGILAVLIDEMTRD